MKKPMIRFLALLIAVSFVLTVVAACNKDPDITNPDNNNPQYVYVAESIPLPQELGSISDLNYLNDKVYFISNLQEYDSETHTLTFSSDIYSINTDGTGLTPLPDYTPPTANIPDAPDGVYIDVMHIDSEESIWVVERWINSSLVVQAGGTNGEDDSSDAGEETVDFGFVLRKLDLNGKELLSVDISSFISDSQRGFSVDAFNTDSSGNIYICVNNWSEAGIKIYVLGSTGEVLFWLADEERAYIPMLIKLSDGFVGYTDLWSFTEDDDSVEIQKIDIESQDFGSITKIPNAGSQILSCGAVYDILINNFETNYLYGFNFGNKEPTRILNWESIDVQNFIEDAVMISDELIICINYSVGFEGYELLIISKVLSSERVEKTTLSLATFYLPGVRDYVNVFNRLNSDYRIQITDYSQFNTGDDNSAGLTRLTAEIIATGRQIMAQLVIGNFWHYQRYKEAFGGDLVFKGLPVEGRNGNALFITLGFAMTSGSENKEGVWEFLKMLLDEDFQLNTSMYKGFLTNKAAFNTVFEKADELTPADLEKIIALIDSASGFGDDLDEGVWNIIREGAMDFYNGRNNAQETARIIQSRVSTLVSERS